MPEFTIRQSAILLPSTWISHDPLTSECDTSQGVWVSQVVGSLKNATQHGSNLSRVQLSLETCNAQRTRSERRGISYSVIQFTRWEGSRAEGTVGYMALGTLIMIISTETNKPKTNGWRKCERKAFLSEKKDCLPKKDIHCSKNSFRKFNEIQGLFLKDCQ